MHARRRSMAVAAVPLLVVLAVACGGDDDDSASSTTTTTASTSTSTSESTTTTSTTAFVGSTAPTSVPARGSTSAFLSSVAVDEGLVTFGFRSGSTPGVDVRYVQPPITQDASGEKVEVKGGAFLQVRMEPASAVDITKDPIEKTYTGPDRVPGAGSITEVVQT